MIKSTAKLAVSICALSAAFAGTAAAAPGDFVNEWAWTSTGTFINWRDSLGSTGTNSNFIFTDPLGQSESTIIGWGGGSVGACTSASNCTPGTVPTGSVATNADFASLELVGGASSNAGSNTITTALGAENVIGLNFRNSNVASSSVTLENAEIRVSFDLEAVDPVLGSTTIMKGEIELEFFEIDDQGMNMGDSFQCIGGTTPTGPCADIIIVNEALDNAFSFNDVDYMYDIGFEATDETNPGGGLSPLTTLSDSDCAALGKAAGCMGFFVQEAFALQGAFTLDIRATTSVSEPAALGLLGLGLMGVGIARRRR